MTGVLIFVNFRIRRRWCSYIKYISLNPTITITQIPVVSDVNVLREWIYKGVFSTLTKYSYSNFWESIELFHYLHGHIKQLEEPSTQISGEANLLTLPIYALKLVTPTTPGSINKFAEGCPCVDQLTVKLCVHASSYTFEVLSIRGSSLNMSTIVVSSLSEVINIQGRKRLGKNKTSYSIIGCMIHNY